MKAECSRVFLSWRFPAAVLLSAVFGILDILTYYNYSYGSVVELYSLKSGGWGLLFMLSLTVCTMPGVLGICEDKAHGLLVTALPRFGIVRYAACKTTICAISSFLASILGDLLFSLAAFFIGSGEFISDSFIQSYVMAMDFFLLKGGHGLLHYLALLVFYGLRVSFYALLSLVISAFLKNKYAVLALPVVLYYALINFTYYIIKFPEIIDPFRVYFNYTLFMGDERKGTGYALVYTLAVGIAAAVILSFVTRRRAKS